MMREIQNADGGGADFAERLQDAQQELSDIELLLDQSQSELERVTQRNATVSGHLQQVLAQIDDIPVAEVQAAYDAAMEAQQRLTVMRGQLEKLQGDKKQVERYVSVLQGIQGGGSSVSNSFDRYGGEAVFALIQAQEAERQRLSRRMHDGPAQSLSNFVLQAEIAMRLFEMDPDKARKELEDLKEAASKTFQNVRDFIAELRPVVLDEMGLIESIRRFAESFAKKQGIQINVIGNDSEELINPALGVLLFRSFLEIVTSRELNQQAKSVEVDLSHSDQSVILKIRNDGRGFDSAQTSEEAGALVEGLRERGKILGGSFDFSSADSAAEFVIEFPLIS